MSLRHDGHAHPRLTRLVAQIVGGTIALAVVVAGFALRTPPEAPREVVVAPAAAIQGAASVASNGTAERLFPFTTCVQLVNAARANVGQPPLSVDPRLSQAAHDHSADQAARLTMTHTGVDGSDAGDRMTATGYNWSAWGENVARGQPDCSTVVSAWLNSPGHRANILSGAFVHIGIGSVEGSNGQLYWTMKLAAPR